MLGFVCAQVTKFEVQMMYTGMIMLILFVHVLHCIYFIVVLYMYIHVYFAGCYVYMLYIYFAVI